MNIREISDKIYSNVEDRERMERMNAVYYEMADYIKEHSPTAYSRFYDMAEEVAYSVSLTDAQRIVRNMQPYGERWTYDDIADFVKARGVDDTIDYYLVMNMMCNDYYRTANEYGVDKAEFYFSLARDFINDPDGKPHKVADYFM